MHWNSPQAPATCRSRMNSPLCRRRSCHPHLLAAPHQTLTHQTACRKPSKRTSYLTVLCIFITYLYSILIQSGLICTVSIYSAPPVGGDVLLQTRGGYPWNACLALGNQGYPKAHVAICVRATYLGPKGTLVVKRMASTLHPRNIRISNFLSCVSLF